jgi:hypothetical protein
MKGQWIGKYSGSDTGDVIINVDEQESNYYGVTYLVSDNKSLPTIVAYFQTENKRTKFNIHVNQIYPLEPSGIISDNIKIKKYFPDAIIPMNAVIKGYFKKKQNLF